jgi:hypothetical protein
MRQFFRLTHVAYAAAELAGIENEPDNPNPKTTRPPAMVSAIQPIMYYCVFIQGKEISIHMDANYKQYRCEVHKFLESLKSMRDVNT